MQVKCRMHRKNAKLFAHAVRSHWGIENSCHWVLNGAFREDQCWVRKDHDPENLAILRHIVLNLVREAKTAKVGVKYKRLKAGWENRCLAEVLFSKGSIP